MKTREELHEILLPNVCYAPDKRHHIGTKGWGILQDLPEFLDYLLFVQDEYKDEHINFIEIGTMHAGFTRALSLVVNFDQVVLMDNHQHVKVDDPILLDNLKHIQCQELHLFDGDSHSQEAVDFLDDLRVYYDLAFIDGDHSCNGVEQDTHLTMPWMIEGGLMTFHDCMIHNPPQIGTMQFFNALKDGLIKELSFKAQFLNTFGIGVFQYD